MKNRLTSYTLLGKLLLLLMVICTGCADNTPPVKPSPAPQPVATKEDSIKIVNYILDAKVARDSGRLGHALDTLELAAALARDYPNPRLQTKAFFKLGHLQNELDLISPALRNLHFGLDQARSISRLRDRDSSVADFYQSLAGVYAKLAMQDSALLYIDSTIRLRERLYGFESSKMTSPLSMRTVVLRNLGRLQEAIQCADSLIRLRSMPSLFDHKGLGIAYSNASESYLDLGDTLQTARYLDSASFHFGFVNNPAHLADLEENRAELALYQGHLMEAEIHMLKALNQFELLPPRKRDGRAHGKLYCTYGKVLLAQKRSADALSAYHRALLYFEPEFSDTHPQAQPRLFQLGREPYTFVALMGKAKARMLDASQHDSVRVALGLAFRFADKLRRGFANVNEQFTISSLLIPEFEDAIDFSFSRKDFSSTFEWIERSKANALLDALADVQRLQLFNLPDSIFQRGRAIQDSIDDCERLGTQSSRIAKGRLINELQALQGRYRGHLQPEHSFVTIDSLRDLLPDSAMFISYFVEDSNIYIAAASQSMDTCIRVARDVAFDSSLTIFMETVRERRTELEDREEINAYAEAASHIFDELIGPLLKLDKGGNLQIPPRLIIAPDGDLAFIPFQALLTRHLPSSMNKAWKNLPYLFKESVISYVHSGTHLKNIKTNSRPIAQNGVYGMGIRTVLSDRSLSLLPNTTEEIEQAVGTMGGLTLLEKAATESILKTRKQKFDILHLATHGILNDKVALNSSIELNPDAHEDGQLHAYEVFQLNLNERMAVLSACETGAGKAIRGQGVLSMGHAFQVAGCPTVIMSLWKLNDEDTQQIMEAFYTHLSGRATGAQALNMAIKTYFDMGHGVDFYHPHRWAPLVLVGDGEQTFVAEPSHFWRNTILIGLGALVLLLLLRMWRRR